MAITYPLEMPRYGDFAAITLRSINVVALSVSQFTLAQQVQAWPGQGWQAEIEIPRMQRHDAQRLAAWLTGLRGQVGTFLLGDPVVGKAGTATAATVSGAAGDSSLAVVMAGSLLAGDHLQIGLGAQARLHMVLSDQDGDGTLEVWPALRRTVAPQAAILAQPRGLFRLAQSSVEWTMQPADLSAGLTLSAIEVP